MYPCGHDPPGAPGFGTGSTCASAVLAESASAMARTAFMATACSGGVRLLQFRLARRPCCRYLLGTMLWRSTNSPARRPEGFIEPCLPTLGHSVPTGSQWAYEIKHDGFRFICRRDGDRVRVFSRRPAVLA